MYFFPLWLASEKTTQKKHPLSRRDGSKVMRLCIHPVGSAGSGRGENLLGDLVGGCTRMSMVFFHYQGDFFEDLWHVFLVDEMFIDLCILKILPKYTVLRVIYISGTYPGTLISFFENNLSFNLGLCVNVLCVLEMFWPRKMGIFLGPCEFKSLFFFFWRKIHEKSFPWTFAWLRDRCVKNWVIFEEFTNFTWHISDVCLGKFCDSLIWRQTHIYISLVKWLTSPKEPHQKDIS